MKQKEHASRDDKGYTHGLKIEKTLQYVQANKRQLQDLVRFATNPIKFSVVSMAHVGNVLDQEYNEYLSLLTNSTYY